MFYDIFWSVPDREQDPQHCPHLIQTLAEAGAVEGHVGDAGRVADQVMVGGAVVVLHVHHQQVLAAEQLVAVLQRTPHTLHTLHMYII